MILLNLPTAYMTFPHCTIWRIMFSGLVFFSRCGVPLAGFGDTGPAAAGAARPAGPGAVRAADEAGANPDAPAISATVITPAVPHQRQCPGLRIVSLTPTMCGLRRYDRYDGVPDLDLVPFLQALRGVETTPVEPGAVGRAEVLDKPQAVRHAEPAVVPGGELVADGQAALPARGEVGPEGVALVSGLDDQG